MTENSIAALSGNELSKIPSDHSNREKVSIKIDFSKTSSQTSVKKAPDLVLDEVLLSPNSPYSERSGLQIEENKEQDEEGAESHSSFESHSSDPDAEGNEFKRSQSGKQVMD